MVDPDPNIAMSEFDDRLIALEQVVPTVVEALSRIIPELRRQFDDLERVLSEQAAMVDKRLTRLEKTAGINLNQWVSDDVHQYPKSNPYPHAEAEQWIATSLRPRRQSDD